MLWFERRMLSILENIWYSPLRYEFEDRACRRFAWQGSLRYPQPNPIAHKEDRMERPVAFESLRTIRISDTANGPHYPTPSKRC
jgi:hypothetical protein